MASLNPSEIEQIRQDIRNGGINMPELEEDLLDHFCCTIEQEMEEGQDFHAAYHEARRIICPEGLHKVQQDTIRLMNQGQNRTLKRFLYGFGFLSAFTLLMGSLFKMMHWPMGGELMLLNAVIMFGVFLPVFLIFQIRRQQRKSTWEKITYLLGTGTSAIIALGTMFKFMHWPGANILFIMGLFGFTTLFLPMLFFLLYKRSLATEGE